MQGQGGEKLLDSYHAERHPVAAEVIKFTSKLTRAGTIHNDVAIKVRNEVMHAVAGFPRVKQALVNTTAEVVVAYPDSPIVVRSHPRHAKVAPGDQAPPIDDPSLRDQLHALLGPDSTEHVILTIVGPGAVPATSTVSGATSVLDADADDSPMRPDYDSVIADSARVIAARYGLREGGRVVIRPDGYIGQITDLHGDVNDYFALLARPVFVVGRRLGRSAGSLRRSGQRWRARHR